MRTASRSNIIRVIARILSTASGLVLRLAGRFHYQRSYEPFAAESTFLPVTLLRRRVDTPSRISTASAAVGTDRIVSRAGSYCYGFVSGSSHTRASKSP